MTGPFGGAFEPAGVSADGDHAGSNAAPEATRESLAPDLAAALSAAFTVTQRVPVDGPESPPPDTAARVIWFGPDPHGLRYDGDLLGLSPLPAAGLDMAALLTALARAARRLEHLHALGVVHGDVRPDMVAVRSAGDGAVLLVPSARSAPGAIVRARLRQGGADPTAVGFVAPELAAGVELTPASDVYALAATVHATLTGHAPLGQLSFFPRLDPLGALGTTVARALSERPADRPPLGVLSAAIERAATAACAAPTGGTANAGAPYRAAGPWTSPVSAASGPGTQPEPISGVLLLVLVLGGLIAFVGAVLLVVAGWDVVGEFGRVAMMAALAAAAWGAGSIAARKGLAAGAGALRAVSGLFGLVAAGYSFYLLDEVGRLAFLGLMTAGALGGGLYAEKRGAPNAGAALVALGTQLVWAVGGWWLHITHHDGPGAFSAVAAVVTAMAYGLALGRKATLLGALAALDFAVFAAAFGAFLSTGAVTGPATYALTVALGYIVLAAGAAWQKEDGTGTAFSIGALLCAWGSALAGVVVLAQHESQFGYAAFGTLWPYLVLAVAAACLRAREPYRHVALVAAAGVVVAAPTAASMAVDGLGHTVLAAIVGFAVIAAGLFVPRLARDEGTQQAAVLAGMVGAAVAPGWAYLRVAGTRENLGPLALVLACGAGMMGLAYAASARGGRQNAWRTLEGMGLAMGLGVLTLRALEQRESALAGVVPLLVAGAVLAYARAQKRLVPAVAGGVALVLNGWIQYFARLAGVLPVSVLLVGFGGGLLVLGVLYEQNVKKRLPELKGWR